MRSGKQGETSKRFGVRDVARVAQVSVGTVDRALNGRGEINAETRKRILAIAQDHGYVPNLTARALSFSKSSLRIGLCIPREIRDFYDSLQKGVLEEAQSYAHVGVEVLYRPVPKLSSPSRKAIQDLLEIGIRALILTPGLSSNVAPLIREAEEQHDVRVVCVASDNSPSGRSSAISVDPAINGALAAELLSKLIAPQSKVAIITGMLDTEEHRLKVEAFQRRFPVENGGSTLPPIEGHEEPAEVYAKTRRLLIQNKNLAGIYVSTVNCVPVCQAVEERGLSGKVKIVATDLFPDLAPFFERGTLSASIYQNPYRQGQLAVRSIVDHFLNNVEFPVHHHLSPVIAMRANLGMFREMMRHEPSRLFSEV